MKVLITGGAGFIGTNFAYHYFNAHPDYEIVVLDKLTYAGRRENLSRLETDKRFKFIQADLIDKEVVHEIFEREKFDMIVNFAAESHVDRSIDHPRVFPSQTKLALFIIKSFRRLGLFGVPSHL